MSTLIQKSGAGSFSPNEIFKVPGLDIYEQMICIVLSTVSGEKSSLLPMVSEIAGYGRMSAQQVIQALQSLTEKKILTHKAFREIVGDFSDNRLSWAAKGLLLYLKSNPSIPFRQLVELAGQAERGEETVRDGLEELRRYGYPEAMAVNGETKSASPGL